MRGCPAGTGGDPELEAAEAANAPPPPEEEDEEELTAGEHAVKRRLENAAKKGRLNFQPKVETKARPPPRPGRARGLLCDRKMQGCWRSCVQLLGRDCSHQACRAHAEPAAQAPAKKRGAAAGRGGAGRGARGGAQAGRGRGKP
jgi:hypothetical protein